MTDAGASLFDELVFVVAGEGVGVEDGGIAISIVLLPSLLSTLNGFPTNDSSPPQSSKSSLN